MKIRKHILIKTLVAILLLPVFLYGFIQTTLGKKILAVGLSNALSQADGVNIQITSIRGWIPMKVSIGEMTVGDAEGEWLVCRDLHCRWQLEELLNHQVYFRSLGAKEIIWRRFPKGGNKPKSSSGEFSGLPEMLNVALAVLLMSVPGVTASTGFWCSSDNTSSSQW